MKRFNLLFDPWIPVIRTNQSESNIIAAYEIVKKDILALDAPRADFNAALMQFLIGLLQTTIAPGNPRAWRNLFNQPPSEDELKNKFEEIRIKDAFYLNGDGYRFMQDVLSIKTGKPRPIEEMIFGAPGISGKDKNQDHFVKRNDIDGLCYSCVAMALLTANLFAEDGGSGYFQSMRGNGFVSCLVQSATRQSEKSLWKDLWLNILEDNIESTIDSGQNFYWMKDLPEKPYVERLESKEIDINDLKIKKKAAQNETHKNEIDEKIRQLEIESDRIKKEIDSLGDNKIVYPESGSLQAYWAWMRRFYLDMKNTMKGNCSVCHRNDELVTNFYKVSKGYKYPKEEWQNIHPFSPSMKYHRDQYTKENLKYKDKMIALEMTENGLPYTYWQDFLTQTDKQAPAKIVTKHLKEKRSDEQLIIWAFGYAMDSNSPRGWYESKTPFYLLKNEEQRKLFEIEVGKYVQAANKIADDHTGYLIYAIKSAWYDENKEKNKIQKKSFNNLKASEIAKCFWNNTENKFYELMEKLYYHVDRNILTDEKKAEFRQEWYEHIKRETKSLFDRWAFTSGIQNNSQRIAKAYNKLMEKLNDKFLKQEILALP
jgi:CRISPR system Cascade subunit CasA